MSIIRAFARIAPRRAFNPAAATAVQSRTMMSVTQKENRTPMVSALNPMGTQMSVRHGGVSILGCGLAMVGIGGCVQGMGTLFAALVIGTARNPSMKDDLFTYTLIGLGFVELFSLLVFALGVFMLFSE